MGSLIRALVNGLLWFVALLLRRPRASVHRVHEFLVVVVNTRPDIRTRAVLERIEEALALIAKYQPVRYRHLNRDVRAFLIKREAHRGHYMSRERVIMTELTFLARRDISAAIVASSILHEGVHARVHALARTMAGYHRGVRSAFCRKAELRFGEALPSTLREPVIERARSILARDDDDLWVRSSEQERLAAVARADSKLPREAS